MRIPGELPLLFVAGADDPVGAYGRNVRKVYEKYREAGADLLRIFSEALCLT